MTTSTTIANSPPPSTSSSSCSSPSSGSPVVDDATSNDPANLSDLIRDQSTEQIIERHSQDPALLRSLLQLKCEQDMRISQELEQELKQVQSKGRELEETWQQRETSNASTTGGGTTPLCKALSLLACTGSSPASPHHPQYLSLVNHPGPSAFPHSPVSAFPSSSDLHSSSPEVDLGSLTPEARKRRHEMVLSVVRSKILKNQANSSSSPGNPNS